MSGRPAPRPVRTACGRHASDGGQPLGRPPNDTRVIRRWGRRGTTRRGDTHALRCGDDGLSPIHSPYYRYSFFQTPRCGKGRTVKFRCEREVLADALATAGRAATSRTGTLPVLSGLRLEVRGDELTVTGTDLELSIRLTVTVGGERDGAVVVPARLVADIVRSLPPGAVEVSVVDEEVSISAGRSQFSIRPLGLDDYPQQGEPAAEAVTLSSAAVAEALRQVVRAASTDDARPCSPGC